MPQRYNAESEIVLPVPNNDVLEEQLNHLGDFAEMVVVLEGKSPGVNMIAGIELGIETALADPDAARRILVQIDSRKAESGGKAGAVDNAEARGEFVQRLIDAASGVQIIAPPQTPGARDWTN